jgi:hypothetical protein
MLDWLKGLFGGGKTAARQQGDPTVLDRPDDPRGGTQSEEYRHADPRDVTSEGGTTMSGPAGAPQEGLSTEERRERDFGPAAQRSEAEPGGKSD